MSLLLAGLLGFFGMAVVALVLHEAAHALAAYLVGMQVSEICIGRGRPLYRTRIRETEIVIGSVPSTGHVKTFPQLSRRRLATVFFVAAGPLMDFALLVAVASLARVYGGYAAIDAALSAAIICLFLSLFSNLWPRILKSRDKPMANDGLLLCRTLFGKDEAGQAYRDACARVLEKNLAKTGDRARISRQTERVLHHLLTLFATPDPEAGKTIAALERELARGMPPHEERLVLDMLVSHRLGYDSSLERDKLDRWSLRALALCPGLPTLNGSRGAVLIELGRYEEALAMLDHADMSDSFNRCLTTAFRALALQKSGRSDEAIARFADAQATAGEMPVLGGIVERILARVETEIAVSQSRRQA